MLIPYNIGGIEFTIDDRTGEVAMSYRGYARLAGIDESTVRKRYKKTAELFPSEKTEVLTAQGIRTAGLIPDHVINKWLQKDNPELHLKFSYVGIQQAFHRMAGYIHQPATPTRPADLSRADILRMALDAENERLAIAGELEKAKEEIEELKPLAKMSETLSTAGKTLHGIGELAQSYGIGRQTFFVWLREIGFIQQESRLPYQVHLDAGRCEVVQKQRKGNPEKFDSVTLITPKGHKYLAGKMAEADCPLNPLKQQQSLRLFEAG